MMRETDSGNWYRHAFDEYYTDLYAHRDEGEAARFVEVLGAHVALANALVLDLACGAGRHIVALAKAGARPVGLDLSSFLLRQAAQAPTGPLVRGEMRALPFETAVFDGAVSMFTSFGYFAKMKDEMEVLSEMNRCLAPRGWFVIDYMNADLVRKSLEPRSRRKVRGLDVLERRRISPGGDRVLKEIELRREGRVVKRYCESVRLMGREELNAMLVASGLEPHVLMGGYNGEEYSESTSQRLIAICRKRERA